MKNELFTIGPFTVYGYGLMIAIGVLAAYFVGTHRAKKQGLEPDMIFSLIFWCLIWGYAGSKLLFILTQLKEIIADPSILLNFGDGWVVFGGILGGILGAWLCCKFHKQKFSQYFDIAAPLVALAQGFGRIGCFLAGCCYGTETSSWFHITFHNSAYAPNDEWLVPTQLLSSAFDFANFFLLSFLATKVKKEDSGVIGGLYLVFYSIGRFVLEFFRGDLERGSVGTLSTSQFIAIFTLIAGVLIVVIAKKQNKQKSM